MFGIKGEESVEYTVAVTVVATKGNKAMPFKPVNLQRNVATALVLAALWGCSPSPTNPGSPPSALKESDGCLGAENLLEDVELTLAGDRDQRWELSQHTGPLSFELFSSDGELSIARIGSEPWMLLKQTVQDPRLAGSTLIYSVELKGEGLSGNFGFEPKAGLYTRIGTGGRAKLAPQSPNTGDWDWQPFTEQIELPAAVDRVQVGFVHQTGGSLGARNPRLSLYACE